MKKLDVFLVICLITALVYGFIWGEKSYSSRLGLLERIENIAAQVEHLKEENERLSYEIRQLSGNRAYIEEKAREYGLIKKGEVEIKN